MADNNLRKSVHVNEISEAAVAGVQGREFYHDPVMLKECLEGLNIKPRPFLRYCPRTEFRRDSPRI